MRWECARGCGMAGSKRYPTAEHAGRFAAALNRVDRAALGRRPRLSLMPLALLDRARPGEMSAVAARSVGASTYDPRR